MRYLYKLLGRAYHDCLYLAIHTHDSKYARFYHLNLCDFFISGEVRTGESSQQRDFVCQRHREQRGLVGAGVHRQEQETYQPLQRNIGGQCSFLG